MSNTIGVLAEPGLGVFYAIQSGNGSDLFYISHEVIGWVQNTRHKYEETKWQSHSIRRLSVKNLLLQFTQIPKTS